jgi:hypothetical protein
MHNFTTEDLLLFLYNELPETKAKEICGELTTNWSLQQKLETLKEVKIRLGGMPGIHPDRQVVDKLLVRSNFLVNSAPVVNN